MKKSSRNKIETKKPGKGNALIFPADISLGSSHTTRPVRPNGIEDLQL